MIKSLPLCPQLVEVNGSPRLKVTEDKEKTTIPGSKVVYRLWDAAGEIRTLLLSTQSSYQAPH